MDRTTFRNPVWILVGLGLPTKVESVMAAYALLNDWPLSRRNSEHSIALKACKAALAGEIDAETARGTFVAFAHRNNLLVPDTDGVLAAQAAGALGRGRPVAGGPWSH